MVIRYVEVGDPNNPMDPGGEHIAMELENLIKTIEEEINSKYHKGYFRLFTSLGEKTIYSDTDPQFLYPIKKVERFMLLYS